MVATTENQVLNMYANIRWTSDFGRNTSILFSLSLYVYIIVQIAKQPRLPLSLENIKTSKSILQLKINETLDPNYFFSFSTCIG